MITDVVTILIGILGLALLMVVHEAGHLLAARAFGLRVTTFSIGFGPTFFKIEPNQGYFWFVALGGKVRLRLHKHNPDKHGETVYQVAAVPFLAYVQIAGMNPFEEIDPEDKSSYANASLLARICTIFGGPLANYLFASVFFFFSFFYGGIMEQTETAHVAVMEDHPAAKVGLKDGDRIVSVNQVEVSSWDELASNVSKYPEKEIEIVVEREGQRLTYKITPIKKNDRGLIGVRPQGKRRDVPAAEAVQLAVTTPPLVVRNTITGLAKWFSGKMKAKLGGPVMIIKESARAMRSSFTDWLYLLGVLSAYLGAFNLIPFPALDGGRMIFLGYELTTRRRPNARVEAHIHVVGLMMLLGLMLYVTIFNDFELGK